MWSPPSALRTWARARRWSPATSSAAWRPMTDLFPCGRLAHAARLIREARQLGQYGIEVSEPVLDYPRLLARVREVVHDVRAHSTLREQIDSLGVSVHEHAGVARFVDRTHHRNERPGCGCRLKRFIVCTGGIKPAARRPRLRVHEHSQRRLEPDFGPAVDAGHWRRGHGSRRSPRSSTHLARECNSSSAARASCQGR